MSSDRRETGSFLRCASDATQSSRSKNVTGWVPGLGPPHYVSRVCAVFPTSILKVFASPHEALRVTAVLLAG